MLRVLYGLKRCCPAAAEELRRRSSGGIPVPSRGAPSFASRRSPSTLSEPRVATGFRLLSGGAETLTEGKKAPMPSSGTPPLTALYSSSATIPVSTNNKMRVIVEVHTYASCSFSFFVDPNDTVGTLKTMAQKKLNIYFPDMFVYLYCTRSPEGDECTPEGCDTGGKVYCNKVLEDDTSTLEECGIRDGDRVLIFSRQSGLLRIQFDESYLYGGDIFIMARSFDKVRTLKEKIKIEKGISESRQTLHSIHNMRALGDDESLLVSYGIIPVYGSVPGSILSRLSDRIRAYVTYKRSKPRPYC